MEGLSRGEGGKETKSNEVSKGQSMSVWVELEGVQVVDIVCETRRGSIVKVGKHEHEEEAYGVGRGA